MSHPALSRKGGTFTCSVSYRLVAIVVPVVVIVVVFMVPVAFVIVPAVWVMVPVWMAPVGSGIRRTLPDAGHPDVTASIDSPESVNPNKTLARRRWTPLVAQRRWGPADNDADLPNGRNGECGERSCGKCRGQKLRLPIRSCGQGSLLSDFSKIGCRATTSRCPIQSTGRKT